MGNYLIVKDGMDSQIWHTEEVVDNDEVWSTLRMAKMVLGVGLRDDIGNLQHAARRIRQMRVVDVQGKGV